MPENLVRPFAVTASLLKAVKTQDGEWVLSGPIAAKGEDYDGDIIDDAAVKKGLTFFDRLGKHVDWGHMYARTKNPKYLIGKGIHFQGPDGRTWLKTVLDKTNEIAQELWKKATSPDGFACGYSLEGLLKGHVQEKNRRRIIDTEIHRITIDPSPKGYGNHLQVGMPAGSFAQLSKSVSADCKLGLCESGWIPESKWRGFEDGERAFRKSMTTGAGIVQDGATGGQAIRKQNLQGSSEQTRCPECGCKNLLTREKCRKCGHRMKAKKAVDPLVRALAAKGVRNAEQLAAQIRQRRNSA